jgi:hypothetical protein
LSTDASRMMHLLNCKPYQLQTQDSAGCNDTAGNME